mmetsp:Transcript_44943/g.106723  ORF Transcript_44943/g.106723 Transcript_44943/m.106723 type:complete len:318 (+) Transcript_44943:63-1016(+)
MKVRSAAEGGAMPSNRSKRFPFRGPRLLAGLVAAVLLACSSYLLLACAEAAQAFGNIDDYGVYTLVLLRHGESEWNLQNRFTGWVDVDVTAKGAEEAVKAGALLNEANISVDVAFTSVQKRAIKTLNLALEEMDLLYIPVEKSWRLNERMYGDLQGLNKAETQQKFGEEKVTQWRRSFDVPPPPIADDNEYHPRLDKRFASVPKKELPLTESLKLTIRRVLPFWKSSVMPALKKGKKVLIAAHGNSLRALVKYLDNIPEEKIVSLNIPTAVPLVYKLNRAMKPIALPDHAEHLSGVYLGDPEWVNAKINGVANQAKR